MNIIELIEKKRKLESDILNCVNPLYEKFKKETKVSADYIGIDIMPSNQLGLPHENFIIGISVNIKI